MISANFKLKKMIFNNFNEFVVLCFKITFQYNILYDVSTHKPSMLSVIPGVNGNSLVSTLIIIHVYNNCL